MMKKCLCLIIYTIAFLSCTSKDGDWEPMEWEVDTSAYLKKDHIAVPESGGTYTLFCNNYATFWLSSVFEDGVQIETDSTVGSAAKGMWSSIEIRMPFAALPTVLLEVLQKACGVLLKYAKMQ